MKWDFACGLPGRPFFEFCRGVDILKNTGGITVPTIARYLREFDFVMKDRLNDCFDIGLCQVGRNAGIFLIDETFKGRSGHDG